MDTKIIVSEAFLKVSW